MLWLGQVFRLERLRCQAINLLWLQWQTTGNHNTPEAIFTAGSTENSTGIGTIFEALIGQRQRSG